MGICKCKKRTDLFCFVHKKAVCEQCICTDHQTCVVRTYVEWLKESEYEPAVCGICKGELFADNVVRLLCMDLFHPECIDVYSSSLPPHTAQAGYVCPTCNNTCIIPPASNRDPLAQNIRKAFESSTWTAGMASNGDTPADKATSNGVSHNHDHDHDSTHSGNDDAKYLEDLYVQPLDLPPHNAPSSPSPYYPPNPYASTPSSASNTSSYTQNTYQYPPSPAQVPSTGNLYGVASRKGHQQFADMLHDDEDEDKYRKKGITQLFSFLGLLSSSDASVANKKGGRSSRRPLVILFSLLAVVGVLWVFMSAAGTQAPELTQEGEKVWDIQETQ
eukprot:TRINITY_DN4758_c0_g1_i1.p1 TRINITY_DN4758_c0_g1~~TRINITY_DN4758_c0_g1_i1.p1  ORF type:complete len:331 (-),score=96.26 TRINITY_DN4758_c0_g1_i1:65-1057(-)